MDIRNTSQSHLSGLQRSTRNYLLSWKKWGLIENSRVSKELARGEMSRFYVTGDCHHQGPLFVVRCLCIAACLIVKIQKCYLAHHFLSTVFCRGFFFNIYFSIAIYNAVLKNICYRVCHLNPCHECHRFSQWWDHSCALHSLASLVCGTRLLLFFLH